MKCYELQKEDKWEVGDILEEGDFIRLISKNGNYCFSRLIKELFYSTRLQPGFISEGYHSYRKTPKNNPKADFQQMNG